MPKCHNLMLVNIYNELGIGDDEEEEHKDFEPEALPKPIPKDLDAVECLPWLDGIGMSHYAKTFLANFPYVGHEDYVSIRKMSSLRIQDFPRMNITDYDHQRLIYDHIQIKVATLSSLSNITAAESPEQSMSSKKTENCLRKDDSTVSLPRVVIKKNESSDGKNPRPKEKVSQGRRSSFDSRVWECISKLRTKEHNLMAIENIRSGSLDQQNDVSDWSIVLIQLSLVDYVQCPYP